MTGRDPRSPLFERVSRLGVLSWSLLGTLLFLGALLWLLTRVANLLPAVAFAVAIIYVLNPVVSWLHRHGMPRLLGSCLSYLALAGLLTLVGFLTLPSITEQARDFGDRFPEIYNDIAGQAQEWADDAGLEVDVPDYEELRTRIEEATESGDFFSSNLSRIGEVTLTILEVLVLLIFAPVLAFYILMDLPKLREQAKAMLPRRNRNELVHVGRQVSTAVGGFLRGQLLVAFIVGLMTSFGFWLIGLPFWLLIGMIAGFLNIIPFVGPWVGGALGVLVGLTETDVTTAVWAAIVAVVVQQIDNHFISPNVLGVTVRLHPATIIVALLAGGTIAGIWGVLLAVPTVAVIKIILGHFWRTRVLDESWEEASGAMIEEHPTGETLITRLRRIGPEARAEGELDEPAPPPPPTAPDP